MKMKFQLPEPLKDWFGYSRRERRASSVLLILILVVAGVRFVFPGPKIDVEEISLNNLEIAGDSSSVINPDPLNVRKTGKQTYNRKVRQIELNTCDSASLEALPGIGPVLATRIIRYRNLLGGYARVAQLQEVYGLPPETYDLISGRLTADSSAVRKIQINSADFKKIIRLPYFDRQEVSAILKYRDIRGRINSMNDLIDNKLIAVEKINKIRPYLGFD